MIRITKTQAQAIVAFASSDCTRELINQIHIDEEHGKIVATDGHRLVVLRAKGDSQNVYGVRTVDWQSAIRLCPHRGELVIDRTAAGVAITAYKGGVSMATVTYKPTDAKFPPYSKVIPERPEKPHAPWGINPRYLADLALVAKAGCQSLICYGAAAGELEPARFESSDGDWLIVIMPVVRI